MIVKNLRILILLVLLVTITGCSNSRLQESSEETTMDETSSEEHYNEEEPSSEEQNQEEIIDDSDIELTLYPQTGMDVYVTDVYYTINIKGNFILHEMQAYYPDEPSDWKISKEYPETVLSKNLDLFKGNVFPIDLTLVDVEHDEFYEYSYAKNGEYMGKGWDDATYEEFNIDGHVYYATNWTMAATDYEDQYIRYRDQGYRETVVYYPILDNFCIYVRHYSKAEPSLESIVNQYHENLISIG